MSLASLLLAIVLLVSSGCGENVAQAKEYMKKGDSDLARVDPLYEKIVRLSIALATDYAAGVNTEPAGVKAEIDEIKALVNKAKDGTSKAKKEYEKIYKLEGVHDYKRYVLIRQEQIDLNRAVDSTVSEMIDIIEASSTTGQAPDVDRLTRLADYLRLLSLGIGETKAKADELKKDKKL